MAESANVTTQIAENGQAAVSQAVMQIDSVKDSINESASVVKNLGERLKEID